MTVKVTIESSEECFAMKKTDGLYEHFERFLFEADFDPFERHEEFARRVADCYWTELQTQGVIPKAYANEVRKDLEAEVLDMLKKKIYGHTSLRHFRENKKGA